MQAFRFRTFYRKASTAVSNEELVGMGADFLVDQASWHAKCKSLSSRTAKRYNCLNHFSLSDYQYCTELATYMVFFAKKPKFEKQMAVIEWLRHVRQEGSDSASTSRSTEVRGQ